MHFLPVNYVYVSDYCADSRRESVFISLRIISNYFSECLLESALTFSNPRNFYFPEFKKSRFSFSFLNEKVFSDFK